MLALIYATSLAALVAVSPVKETVAKPPQDKGVQTTEVRPICRWIDGRTGTNRKERVCLTASQWKKVEQFLAE